MTPPFPEYDSAHAVVAAASATILTHVFGPVGFTETSTATGIVRTYSSWVHAAETSTDSRIWGGFHFPDSCEDGEASGLALGQYILDSGLLATCRSDARHAGGAPRGVPTRDARPIPGSSPPGPSEDDPRQPSGCRHM